MFKLTKTQRKQLKTDKLADRDTARIEAGLKGYMKIMAFLSHGCDVSAA